MMFGENFNSTAIVELIEHDTIGAELGVWKGDTSSKLLKKAKHLHLVDAWSPIAFENSKEFGGYSNYLKRYKKLVASEDPEKFKIFYDKIYQDVCKRFSNQPVTIYRMVTDKWFDLYESLIQTDKNKLLDWIYIDASHEYEGCLKDLTNSFRVLKSNGIIYGDDYAENKPGVINAVNDFIKKNDLKLELFNKNQYRIKL